MKKTILAVAIPALFAASAQAATVYDADGVSADVYGRMQFDISDSGENTDGTGSARMGFNAKSVIATGVSGVAKGEWQLASESSNATKFTARHLYAGFEFDDAGTVVFGQSDTAFYQAVAATDIFNTYGYEAFSLIEDGRQEGQIIYSGEFGGFYVGASYQFRRPDFSISIGNPEDPEYVEVGNLDSGYAATIGYNFDFGLGVYGGYHVEKFEEADKKNMALSASYSWEDLYLGAAFVGTDLDGSKLQGYDLVASYDINATTIYAGYAAQEGKGDLSDLGDTADAAKLGVAYKFNSNMKVWGEYLVDGLEDADNQWTVAVQYNF
ncbi:porin [Agarivorans sp. MS3-6]|uniref:porin n=1 Tax=Agarivorans sp. TSD2052 TaxID=2937286 RepID=UPI00200D7841|nr:porin [Agarivorans sp. TSD2052]UPW16916.1 porin [Agarivorans sp. TSD2052]